MSLLTGGVVELSEQPALVQQIGSWYYRVVLGRGGMLPKLFGVRHIRLDRNLRAVAWLIAGETLFVSWPVAMKSLASFLSQKGRAGLQ